MRFTDPSNSFSRPRLPKVDAVCCETRTPQRRRYMKEHGVAKQSASTTRLARKQKLYISLEMIRKRMITGLFDGSYGMFSGIAITATNLAFWMMARR